MTSTSHSQPAIVGSFVTVSSGAYSFFGTTLAVVQWLAAAVSLVVGVLTIIHLIRNWKK